LFFDFLSSVTYLIVWGICGLALWLGDRPLKVTATALLFFWTITPLVSHWWQGWNVPTIVVDVNALLAMTWISLRWRRLWSTVLVALSALQVLTPFVAYLTHIHRFYWQSAYNVMGWAMLLVMVVAIVLTVRARRRADEGAVRS
jgi:hypothetical protein